MRGSITIATIFGTKVRMHLTFLLLLLWVGVGEAMTGGAKAAISGIVFVLLLFICVVAHEFGHILMARRFGGLTRDILLLPIGGVSRMERMPEGPSQELAVALAGPAVSIGIGLALLVTVGFPTEASIEAGDFGTLVQELAATNIFLALFNLVPAFPMDGGRALRALLAMRLGRVRATRISARMGHFFAGAFVLIGLVSRNPILLLIGIFIYFGASAESADTALRDLSQKLTVADVMRSNVRSIGVGSPVSDAIEIMLHAGQHAIPVVDAANSLLGIATKESIIRTMHREGRGALVGDAMERTIPTVTSGQRLRDVLDLMQANPVPAIAVVDASGELVGIVTPETLADLILVQAPRQGQSEAHDLPHQAVSVPLTA